MKYLKLILIATICFCGEMAAYASTEACDKWLEPAAKPKSVVLLTHGMNLNPARMDDLGEVLKAAGYLVFRPGFTGHCGSNNEDYLQIKSSQWREDAKRVFLLAHAKAAALGVPLNLVAYSFTTLVFQVQASELPFAKRVYLAPALATKFWYSAAVGAANLFPNFTYASKNLSEYLMNKRSGARSLLALDDFMEDWNGGKGGGDQAPSLWIIDPGDELLSFSGLKNACSRMHQCRLFPISNQGSKLPKTYHHLIVDKESLGEMEWARVTAEILRFLSV